MKNLTLIQCIHFFLNELTVSGHAESTIAAYQNDLKQFKDFIKADFPSIRRIQQIKVNHVSCFRQNLLKEKGFCQKTVERKIDCLRAFFSYLLKYEYISNNPVNKLVVKKSINHEIPRYLTYEEISKIIFAAKEHGGANSRRDVALLTCLAYLGCRRSEILGLNWSSINFYEKSIGIYRKKTSNFEILPMNAPLYKVLNQLYMEKRPDPDDPVFISKKGNRLSNTAFNQMFQKYVKLSGLKKDFNITSHVFRHSFCTHLVKQGIPLIAIQRYTGHRDINSLNVYSHVSSEQKKVVMCKLPEIAI